MNTIDFTKNGGYRFKQKTLRKMQESYFEFLKAFVGFCQIPEVGSYILSGCNISGANITAGYLYIDGELCSFAQSPGTTATKIRKVIAIENLAFKNGNNEPVFRYATAATHATEGVALGSFTRVSPVFDANYVSTENNFSDAWITFLMTIEAGAQANVQPDYNQTNAAADDFIKNLPRPLLKYLYRTTVVLGNVGSGETVNVPFPNVGTTNYLPIITLQGLSSDPGIDNDVTYVTFNHTATSVDVSFDQYENHEQNLLMHICLIPL